jgi:hypothetical protein
MQVRDEVNGPPMGQGGQSSDLGHRVRSVERREAWLQGAERCYAPMSPA